MIDIAELEGLAIGLEQRGEKSASDRVRKSVREIEGLRKALTWITQHYGNQDMSHVDFRVEAYTQAIEVLSDSPS